MKINEILIHGTLQQFSIDGKKNVKGWLILSNDEEFYLVKQNSNLFRNRWGRLVYKIDKIPKEDIFKSIPHKKYDTVMNLFWSIPFVALIRILIKKSGLTKILFGKINSPVVFNRGIVNILTLLLIMLISFVFISYYRNYKMNKILNKKKSL